MSGARGTLNVLFQRHKLPPPSYTCTQLQEGAQEPWTCVLSCPAIIAPSNGSHSRCDERSFTAQEPTKRAACTAAAEEALEWYASAGFEATETIKLLREAILKAVRAKVGP